MVTLIFIIGYICGWLVSNYHFIRLSYLDTKVIMQQGWVNRSNVSARDYIDFVITTKAVLTESREIMRERFRAVHLLDDDLYVKSAIFRTMYRKITEL